MNVKSVLLLRTHCPAPWSGCRGVACRETRAKPQAHTSTAPLRRLLRVMSQLHVEEVGVSLGRTVATCISATASFLAVG